MKYLILFFLFVSSIYSKAQTLTAKVVNTNDVVDHISGWTLSEKTDFRIGGNIIQVENTGNKVQLAYTAKLSRSKHALILHKRNSDGKEIATVKLENGDRVFGPAPTEPVLLGNKLLLIYFRYDDNDTMKLYLSEVDDESLTIKNTRLLYKFAQRNVGMFGMMSGKYEIMTSISPDQKKLLVAHRSNSGEMFSAVIANDLSVLRTKISTPTFPEKSEISEALLENSGNCVFGLSSTHGSEYEHLVAKGFFVQRMDNSERVIAFNSTDDNFIPEHLHIQPSADFSKLYVCGDYSGDQFMEGVWVAELNTQKFRLNKPMFFAYPEEFRERMKRFGFGIRRRGSYTVMPVEYKLIEFANGHFALAGYAKRKRESAPTEKGVTRTTFSAGPLATVFLDKGFKKANFSVIPRYHSMGEGCELVCVPYKDKLVVLYNDYVKNFEEGISDGAIDDYRMSLTKGVVLGCAVINKEGKIEQRKALTERLSRVNYFNTFNVTKLSDTHFVIPPAIDETKEGTNKVAEITISD